MADFPEKVRYKESFKFVSLLTSLGVPLVSALSFGSWVEGLYKSFAGAGVKCRIEDFWRACFSGMVTGVLPFLKPGAVVPPEPVPDEEAGAGAVAAFVCRGVGESVLGASGIVERLGRVLVARENLAEELRSTVSRLQLMLVQQHQELRRYYPGVGFDGDAGELLGQRVLRDGLEDMLLPRIYEGLNELYLAVRYSGNWLERWNTLISPRMNLARTRVFMEQVGILLGMLPDEDYEALKRLYAARWSGLDGRMLARCEPKFLWTPE
jgi:hypothetical protein